MFLPSGIQDVDQVTDHGAVALTGLVKPDDPDAKSKFFAAEALHGVPRQRWCDIVVAEPVQNPSEATEDEVDVASTGNVSLNISEVPEVNVPVDCVPTEKCRLGKGS